MSEQSKQDSYKTVYEILSGIIRESNVHLDPNCPENQRMIQACKKAQKEAAEKARIDYNDPSFYTHIDPYGKF